MANLNVHPAPGLGDLTSGFYVVPQNPLQMAAEGVSRVPTLGEFLTGSFVVPQNPFFSYSTGQVQPIGQGAAGTPMFKKGHKSAGAPSLGDLVTGNYVVPQNPINKGLSGLHGDCGCGCGGGCSGGGMGDLTADMTQIESDFSAGNYMNIFSDTILGFPTWAYLAGAAFLYMFLATPSEGSSRIHRGRRRLASAIAP